MAPARSLALLFLFLLLPISSHGRRISLDTPDPSISDGLSSHLTPSFLRLGAAEECEQTYGFLPCTTTALGNLFLLAVYGYLMFLAATFLSNGSEILLEILGPGIVGGLFLPVLGALPDAILILVSGLSGTKEVAQEQVLIGMGLLAGSTVMLLTIVWGSCVVVGKCDFDENHTAIDLQDTKKFSLHGSGVSTDVLTSYAARIMVISIIPFIIVQLPQIFKITAGSRVTVLIALVCSVALLLSYSLYQICQPWIQRRKLAYAKHKHVISGILRHAHKHALGRLVNDDGSPNESVIEKLFERIDLDCDNSLSHQELTALIIGIQFDEIDLDKEDAAKNVMKEFDTSGDATIDRVEFIRGISRWLSVAKSVIPKTGANSIVHYFHARTREEHDQLIDKSDEVVESVENPTWLYVKALSLLLLGTVIAASFADPLVDAVNNFSSATSIPSFFISFIAMPLATNASEAVSAFIFASRKKQRTSSLTFSEIYGAVTMNNTLCLAVFLALVYLRGLKWDFSSEVLIIVIVCVVMGLFASFRTKFPLWTCSVAYVLYPFSLVLVYVLDYVFGWS